NELMTTGGIEQRLAAPAIFAALIVGAPAAAVLVSLAGPYGDAIRHVMDTVAFGYFLNTLLLCAIVGLFSAAFGIGAALLTAVCDFPLRRFFAYALAFPLATPAYIAAYAYADLLGPFGALAPVANAAAALGLPSIKSLPGAALILSLTLYPYVYLTARAAFAAQSASVMETARMLGAAPLKAAFTVLLPMARPAIAGGVALAMMETAAEFGVADYFGVPTLSVGIFRTWHSFGDLSAAAQLASSLFLFSLLLVVFESAGRRGRSSDAPRVSGGDILFPLKGAAAAGAGAFCALLTLAGFAVPAAAIAAKIDPALWAYASRGLASTISNSFFIAAAGVIAAMALTLPLAYSARYGRSAFLRFAVRTATLGYAVPGAVIAIGILSVFSFARDLIGPAVWMTAGPVALVYAYAVRFMTGSYNATTGGLAQIDPGLDAAARTLGASGAAIARRIHAPLLRRAALAGATIVFVDIVKELPATLILRDFNFETLATRVYRLAGDERLAEAAPEALLLIAIGALPIIFFNSLSGRRARSVAE
ncbi:MAG: iron ABC transporter permease, partial [Parvularculaceae bacterium]|nr:iron ABC transporter permease [Parvularculaceae bacterium]